ncbi:N-6 DNA methylase [Anaerovoracaceae bacterium SGI.195]
MSVVISNPPFNMKWKHEGFIGLDDRFIKAGVPPESNANYAFILTALDKADEAILILPLGVTFTEQKDEKHIREYLVDQNLIEAVITCPDNMFEKTTIPTCILYLKKNKKTTTVQMLDLSDSFEEEEREQRGQYGGKAHTNRVYKKTVKILNDEVIEEATDSIKKRISKKGFSKAVSIETIKENDYMLSPNRYIDQEFENRYRNIKNIVDDLNKVIAERNKCKLTINETLAKRLKLDPEIYREDIDFTEANKMLEEHECGKIIKSDYISLTKNKNQLEFKNCDPEQISSVLKMTFSMWKQHMHFLEESEQVYLAELRDALIPKLIGGEWIIEEQEND